MSHPSPEPACSDGEDRARSCAGIPRVIRTAAAAAAASTTRTPGYSPRMSVDMAGVHSWAPYAAVIPTLRYLSQRSISDAVERDMAKDAVARLHGARRRSAPPARFPADEVYVCLDRAPLVSLLQDIQRNIMMAEAAAPRRRSEEYLGACSGYMSAVWTAAYVINGAEDDRGAPVLYDREVFESAFLLTWTEP